MGLLAGLLVVGLLLGTKIAIAEKPQTGKHLTQIDKLIEPSPPVPIEYYTAPLAEKAKEIADQRAAEAAAEARAEAERQAAAKRVADALIAAQVGAYGYTPGQCTAYVASRRNVPGNWGNAVSWLWNAQVSGWGTGPTPRAGAIAWTGRGWAGHVAIVDGVSGGSVLISEMNALYGPYRVDQQWVPASEFYYIY